MRVFASFPFPSFLRSAWERTHRTLRVHSGRPPGPPRYFCFSNRSLFSFHQARHFSWTAPDSCPFSPPTNAVAYQRAHRQYSGCFAAASRPLEPQAPFQLQRSSHGIASELPGAVVQCNPAVTNTTNYVATRQNTNESLAVQDDKTTERSGVKDPCRHIQ